MGLELPILKSGVPQSTNGARKVPHPYPDRIPHQIVVGKILTTILK